MNASSSDAKTIFGRAIEIEDAAARAAHLAAYRFAKFARRNRVALATSIVVLAAILAGTVVSVTQAIRATRAEHLAHTRLQAETEAHNEAEAARQAEAAQRRIAETQSAIAEAQKRQAEANFHKARQAVDEYFTLVRESQLLNVPGLQPLRKQLLEAALRYYQAFLEQRSADPNVRAQFAATYLRVAQVYMQNDRTDDSIRTLKKALGVLEPLLREKPRVADFRQFAGFRRTGRILQFFEMWPSDVAEAVRVSRQAVVVWEQLVREYPDAEEFQSDLASFYHYLGDLNVLIKRPAEALQLFQKACRIWEQLVARHPKNPEYRSGLADDLEYAANQPPLPIPERDADCRRALSLREGLVSEFPAVPEYRAGLANGLRRFAFLGAHKSAAEVESVQIRSLEMWKNSPPSTRPFRASASDWATCI